MQASAITYIDPNAFEHLENLQDLDLSSNPNINISSLKLSLASLQNEKLNSLRFNYMGWKSLVVDVFSGIHRNITLMSIDGNSFNHFSDGLFTGLDKLTNFRALNNKFNKCENTLLKLKSLISLDLSRNNITVCDTAFLPQALGQLRLGYNHLNHIPNFCSINAVSNVPNLRELSLNNNFILQIANESFNYLPALKILTLEKNGIREFPIGVFSCLGSLQSLSLRHMKGGVVHVGLNAFAIPSLKRFSF